MRRKGQGEGEMAKDEEKRTGRRGKYLDKERRTERRGEGQR